jgi:mannose/fructose/N-acetylgalactosamine-specific phosphotransferase system component IID
MTEQKDNPRWKTGVDIISIVCLLYWPYVFVWAHYTLESSSPLPIQMKLLIADILPSALGLIWLFFRYKFIPEWMSANKILFLLVCVVFVFFLKHWR